MTDKPNEHEQELKRAEEWLWKERPPIAIITGSTSEPEPTQEDFLAIYNAAEKGKPARISLSALYQLLAAYAAFEVSRAVEKACKAVCVYCAGHSSFEQQVYRRSEVIFVHREIKFPVQGQTCHASAIRQAFEEEK